MRWLAFGLVVALVATGCGKKKVVRNTGPGDDGTAPAADTGRAADPPPPTTASKPIPPGFQSGGNTNFVPGGGAVQNVRQAARRTVAINDMKQLGLFIEQMYVENGKMPAKDEVVSYIQRDAPKIAQAIKDGDIVLTGTRDHGGLWAHEVEADTKGGIVLVGAAATRATADEVKKLMAQ